MLLLLVCALVISAALAGPSLAETRDYNVTFENKTGDATCNDFQILLRYMQENGIATFNGHAQKKESVLPGGQITVTYTANTRCTNLVADVQCTTVNGEDRGGVISGPNCDDFTVIIEKTQYGLRLQNANAQ